MNDSESIQYVANAKLRNSGEAQATVAAFSPEAISTVRRFHKSFPQYAVTPLCSLNALAENLGVSAVWVKDESFRFGLNAFKVLGGSYAIGAYLAKRLGVPLAELDFNTLKSDAVRAKLGDITFVTATDGNHGRGIAWAARELGQKAVVFMPKGSSEIRLENIRREGAEASITDLNYDDAVRLADRYAREHGGVLVQDSAWEGYEEIPAWIMQGYATIIDEVLEQLKAAGQPAPTHVFLQAGVGSFAGSMLGSLRAAYGDQQPLTAIVEPTEAACIYKSACAADGKPHAVTGFMPTIMAGLACGEPSLVAWGILRDYGSLYIACPDAIAAKGMRMLGNPVGSDPRVISGESGAVGMGLLATVLTKDRHGDLRSALQLNKDSRVLLISTEGDTDPENYRKIVWDGAYPSAE